MKTLPPFPILTINERISLREHTPNDAEAFFNYYTHPKVTEFNIAAPTPKTLQEAKEEVTEAPLVAASIVRSLNS